MVQLFFEISPLIFFIHYIDPKINVETVGGIWTLSAGTRDEKTSFENIVLTQEYRAVTIL